MINTLKLYKYTIYLISLGVISFFIFQQEIIIYIYLFLLVFLFIYSSYLFYLFIYDKISNKILFKNTKVFFKKHPNINNYSLSTYKKNNISYYVNKLPYSNELINILDKIPQNKKNNLEFFNKEFITQLKFFLTQFPYNNKEFILKFYEVLFLKQHRQFKIDDKQIIYSFVNFLPAYIILQMNFNNLLNHPFFNYLKKDIDLENDNKHLYYKFNLVENILKINMRPFINFSSSFFCNYLYDELKHKKNIIQNIVAAIFIEKKIKNNNYQVNEYTKSILELSEEQIKRLNSLSFNELHFLSLVEDCQLKKIGLKHILNEEQLMLLLHISLAKNENDTPRICDLDLIDKKFNIFQRLLPIKEKISHVEYILFQELVLEKIINLIFLDNPMDKEKEISNKIEALIEDFLNNSPAIKQTNYLTFMYEYYPARRYLKNIISKKEQKDNIKMINYHRLLM